MRDEVAARFGHRFANERLLQEALTHSSWAHEHGGSHNERLEFLGDSMLNASTTDLIVARYPEAPEGALSRLRALLVDEATLAGVARDRGLGALLRLGRGEESSGGRGKPRVLADVVEALVGAAYLDAGFDTVRELVASILADRLAELDESGDPSERWKHPRSRLQELTQASWREVPTYTVVDISGPSHKPRFTVAVSIHGRELGRATAPSKQIANRIAAEAALRTLDAFEE